MSVTGQHQRLPAAGTAKAERRTLTIACALHFVHDGIADALYVLLPVWARAFGLSYAEVGTLRMSYSGALALLQMPAGLLAERAGERGLLVGGSLFAGLAFAALAMAGGYVALLSCIVLAGVGCAVQHPLASSLISKAYAPASRRAALGTYNFSGDVGKFVVAAGMGLAVTLIGWRSSALVYGIVVMSIALLALASPVALGRSQAVSAGPHPPSPAAAGGWGFTDRTGFALLSSIQLLDNACRTGFLTFAPFLLLAKGATVASIGFGLALVFLGGATGKLACGLLAERVGILRSVVLTELATGVLILAVILVPLSWAMVLLMPLGIALNGTSSVLYGTVADFVRSERQSRAFGLFYTLGSSAGAVSPLVFGLVSDSLGVATTLFLNSLLAIGTIPLAFLLGPHVAARTPASMESN